MLETSLFSESGRLEGPIRILFLIGVVFAALAHGAVEPWSLFVFEAIIIGLLCLWLIKSVRDRRLTIEIPKPALPIAGLVLLGLIQSIAISGGDGRWLSLSRNVGFTRGAVTVIIFLLIGLLAAATFFRNRASLVSLSHFLVLYGFALALFALIQHFTWNGRFYWLRHTEATSAFGPFANHNHFAGYMELLIPLPIALALTRAVRTEFRILCAFAAAVMAVAGAASLSRGGMMSIVAGIMFLALMSFKLPRFNRKNSGSFTFALSRFAIIAAIVAIIVVGVFYIGADPLINRITQEQTEGAKPRETFFSSRGWVWRDSLSMIRANPILGVGLGAYETAFSMYTQSDGSLRVPQAHNDYLQILADCGIIGGALAAWFLILLFRDIFRGVRSRDPLYSALALGGGAGIFGILVHSLFDFNLQLPSNALLFLLLSAVVAHVGAKANRDVQAIQSPSERKSIQLEAQNVSSASLARSSQ